jgi:hypothetical protein
MNKINEWLIEFNNDMLKKFEEHHGKYGNNSVINQDYDFTELDINWLREEITYHYAKWIYRGVVKKDLKESDTITNAVNMYFLAWIALKIEEQNNCKGEISE